MKIHIVSDGTPLGTHVTAGNGGEEIEMIEKVEFVATGKDVKAILTIYQPSINANNVEAEENFSQKIKPHSKQG